MRSMSGYWRAVKDAYARRANDFNLVLAIIGTVLSIALAVFAAKATLVAEIFAALLLFAVLVFLAVAIVRASAGDRQIAPPEETMIFSAIPYSVSSDADMSQLSRFASDSFGETFPAEVDTKAVRNGSGFGLRLATAMGRNVGFLDVYHFREDVLQQWLFGNIPEKSMTLDDFMPVARLLEQGKTAVNLVVGALYIDTSNPVFDHHLAQVFIEAGREYLELVFHRFQQVTLYATIFSPAGQRWAQKLGFAIHTRAEQRGPAGGGHPVYSLSFSPQKPVQRAVFRTQGRHYEYQIRLVMPADAPF